MHIAISYILVGALTLKVLVQWAVIHQLTKDVEYLLASDSKLRHKVEVSSSKLGSVSVKLRKLQNRTSRAVSCTNWIRYSPSIKRPEIPTLIVGDALSRK